MGNSYFYNILDKYRVGIKIRKNPYELDMSRLFTMAGRINKKRSFLFVSKVLGKHIPVDPRLPLLTGKLLAMKTYKNTYGKRIDNEEKIARALNGEGDFENVYQSLKDERVKPSEKLLAIGFAETATALGHSFFDAFEDNCDYIHTTRDRIVDFDEYINFKEEHSHATGHFLYMKNVDSFENYDRIVLVDDEITTGKTCLNIIKEINLISPGKKYTVVTILDWRSKEDRCKFETMENELGIEINVIALLSGNIDIKVIDPDRELVEEENGYEKDSSLGVNYIYIDEFFNENTRYTYKKSIKEEYELGYLNSTGRFGIGCTDNLKLSDQTKDAGEYLMSQRSGGKCLCMGTEEFMYIAMQIAANMGEDVYYQSTTQSPIYPQAMDGYGAYNAFKFKSPKSLNKTNYFYNLRFGEYDEVFVFFEGLRDIQKSQYLIEELKKCGLKKINIVICTKIDRRC